jgi:hypothetical protein
MAPPIAGTERGQALIEALPVTLILALFVSFMFLASYVIGARVYLQWQSEQALYCAAEAQGRGYGAMASVCAAELERGFRDLFPWGEVHAVTWTAGQDWHVEANWKLGGIHFTCNRNLNVQLIAKKALRW